MNTATRIRASQQTQRNNVNSAKGRLARSTKRVSQRSEDCLSDWASPSVPPETLELPQEAHVAFDQHAQVGHVVLQAGDALHPHAEREAGVLLRVDARHGQHVRIHHAAAEDLQPAGALAEAAALAVLRSSPNICLHR